MRRCVIAFSTAALMLSGGMLLAGCGVDANVAASTVAGKSPAPQGTMTSPAPSTTPPTAQTTTPPQETVPETTDEPAPEPPAPSPEQMMNEAVEETVGGQVDGPMEEPVEEPVDLIGYVQPGGQILNLDNGYACSAGWLAGVGDRRFIITAGHCGAAGHLFAVPDGQGNYPVIGSMVDSYVNGSDAGIFGADIGLIELYPTTVANAGLPTHGAVSGWQDIAWLEATRPEICRVGYRTGLSCGPYHAPGNEGQFYYQGSTSAGDSGGPVFARYGGQLWAVGVTSAHDFHLPAAVGMSIGDWMPGWGLTLYTNG